MRPSTRIDIAVFLSCALWTAGSSAAEAPEAVQVLNFPEIQRVQGTVEVERPISHAVFVRREGEVVSPMSREEALGREPVAVVETRGFTTAVLSLFGEPRGVARQGKVGAILVPDEAPIRQAIREGEPVPLALEVEADIAEGGAYFSAQVHVDVGFPRYLLYFHNSAPKSADVHFYVNLTH